MLDWYLFAINFHPRQFLNGLVKGHVVLEINESKTAFVENYVRHFNLLLPTVSNGDYKISPSLGFNGNSPFYGFELYEESKFSLYSDRE